MEYDDIDLIVDLLVSSNTIELLKNGLTEEEKRESILTVLLHSKNFEFSAENIMVCTEDDKIVGVLQVFVPSKIDPKGIDFYRRNFTNRRIIKTYSS